jgi:hypothetical protein
MNTEHNTSWFWQTLFLLSVYCCLLLAQSGLQLAAWPEDIPKESLIQKARNYRSAGITKPKARSILTLWEAPSSYDQLLAQASLVVLGKFRDQKCRLTADQMHIETIYVFRVEQVIKGQMNWADVPREKRIMTDAEMQPPNNNEVFILRTGGILEVFGVRMQDIETAFPAFKSNQTYLLFLHTPAVVSKYPEYYGQPLLKVYEMISGPHSVIKVDKSKAAGSKIEPFVNNPQLRKELEEDFQSNLSLLLQHFKEGS